MKNLGLLLALAPFWLIETHPAMPEKCACLPTGMVNQYCPLIVVACAEHQPPLLSTLLPKK